MVMQGVAGFFLIVLQGRTSCLCTRGCVCVCNAHVFVCVLCVTCVAAAGVHATCVVCVCSHTRNRACVSHTHQRDDICIHTHKCVVHVNIYHRHPEHADLTLSYLVYLHLITHCNTLQHTATHCNTLQHTATHCNTLHHIATHYNTLQHTTPGICAFEKGTYQKRGYDI